VAGARLWRAPALIKPLGSQPLLFEMLDKMTFLTLYRFQWYYIASALPTSDIKEK